MKKLLFSLFLSLLAITVSLQVKADGPASTGKISGKVIDKSNNEALIGLAVAVQGTSTASPTNIEGRYELRLAPGKYNIVYKYIGYNTKTVAEVEVKAGQVTELNVTMEDASVQTKEAVVTASYSKETINALYTIQKNNITISDGISSDVIKRSPDKNTSEVLRRVSGASIQDNKFVVIRGLADRYNIATINGALLPSTEPDKRAFSFDIFPAALLDNMTITKAATPELPGDFAGGVIAINTKDFPEKQFFSFTAGTSYNTISTFKPYSTSNNGKTDFLGLDDGSRDLPANFPDSKYLAGGSKNNALAARLLPNDWGLNKNESSPLAQSYQLAFGNKTHIGKAKLGSIVALTYNRSERYTPTDRYDYDYTLNDTLFKYKDNIYRSSTSLGALANFSLMLSENNKMSLKNSFTTAGDNTTLVREGVSYTADPSHEERVQAYSYAYTNKKLLNSQLIGEHFLPSNKIKLHWVANYANLTRNEPNQRTLGFSSVYDQVADDGRYTEYRPMVNSTPDKNSRRFYSGLNEDSYGFSGDVSIPTDFLIKKSVVKVGAGQQIRKRSFDSRFLGFKRIPGSKVDQAQFSAQHPDSVFTEKTFADTATINSDGGYVLDEISNPTSNYTASSKNTFGFLMYDAKLTGRLRAVLGARVEQYAQSLGSFDATFKPIGVDTSVTDVLPSMNLTYQLTEKSNLRFSASKTVSRPEFREIAPFAFEDFVSDVVVTGNPKLKRASITNVDLRYELYPGAGQVISVTGFYKEFKDPIEFVYQIGSNRIKTFQNVPKAQAMGLELEFRYKLNFMDKMLKWKQWDNFTFFTNCALIQSKVDVSTVVGTVETERPLQGQSPYLINGGLQYYNNKNQFGASIMFNRVGRRIIEAGFDGYRSVWENSRSLVDVQVSKTFFKVIEAKLNVSDLLAQPRIFYQEMNGKKGYEAGMDHIISKAQLGSTYSMSLSYKF